MTDWLETSSLAAVTSWYPCGPTYYGHRSCSYINHLVISAPWMGRVTRCAVAYNLTRRVRAIPSVAVLHHMIIIAENDYKLTCCAPNHTGTTRDYYSLGRV